jgi:hypothetical protein
LALILYVGVPVLLIGLLTYRIGRRGATVTWRELALYPVAVALIELGLLGMGFTWGPWSVAAKLMSLLLAASFPFLIAQISAGAVRRSARCSRKRMLWAAGASGLVTVPIAFPILHLLLTCLIARDCL